VAVTVAKRLAGRNDHAKVAYGTEASLFQEICGIPSVVIGPGDIDQAHKPDEWIALDQLDRCNAFIQKLIAECRA
jgi:acetylornithine deacetylase